MATRSRVESSPAAAQRRRNQVLVGIGAAVVLTLICWGALNLLDLAAADSYTTHVEYGGIHSIVIDTAGEIQLFGAPAGSATTVTERIDEGLSTPHRQARRTADGVLRLTAGCGVLTQCAVSYEIAVPAGVSVQASSGAGRVSAEGLVAGVALRLHSGSGDVTAQHVSAQSVELSSSTGAVTAQLVGAIRRVVASSDTGSVRLTVPNLVYAVNARSGSGSVFDGSLRTDPAAPRTITASSGSGDVTITTGAP